MPMSRRGSAGAADDAAHHSDLQLATPAVGAPLGHARVEVALDRLGEPKKTVLVVPGQPGQADPGRKARRPTLQFAADPHLLGPGRASGWRGWVADAVLQQDAEGGGGRDDPLLPMPASVSPRCGGCARGSPR
jgi:hypothetical protein